ncbi:hypothetical protein AAG570_001988 [Ranatra chinensis]|uniref:Uncharacterized protein n=1 Tax=Ranatra chinensis TaxID=642074 RepID=A0ABD0YA58_9HEMI
MASKRRNMFHKNKTQETTEKETATIVLISTGSGVWRSVYEKFTSSWVSSGVGRFRASFVIFVDAVTILLMQNVLKCRILYDCLLTGNTDRKLGWQSRCGGVCENGNPKRYHPSPVMSKIRNCGRIEAWNSIRLSASSPLIRHYFSRSQSSAAVTMFSYNNSRTQPPRPLPEGSWSIKSGRIPPCAGVHSGYQRPQEEFRGWTLDSDTSWGLWLET